MAEDSLVAFGWAPGGYSFRCIDCSDEDNHALRLVRWGAKRAFRCEKHALEARYNAQQQTRPACPSCNGLNTSCPDGCGRDPKTGELNGTIGILAPAAGAPKTAVDGAS